MGVASISLARTASISYCHHTTIMSAPMIQTPQKLSVETLRYRRCISATGSNFSGNLASIGGDVVAAILLIINAMKPHLNLSD